MRTIVLLAGICALLASNWATAQTALSASQAYEAASDGSLLLIDLRTARELAETGQPEAAVWIPIQANDFATVSATWDGLAVGENKLWVSYSYNNGPTHEFYHSFVVGW